ncbi:thioredoxin reductase [Chryseobacterium bernardetii]|uniref:Thioredoxin reductase n=2 Tax=Chryseobacterium TaxID=59732 RepID=A0A543EMR8_9FLAO|nr:MULTISPECIES: NAD(P)/FAD-dependent oxidoreductase [Chryseobacterium]MDR6369270.1 thioredoxin reductase [Chryseobacterium vietnamense]MDR6439808.1 thioredoxin reductase [Chryseobacterium bernardetii]MDR6487577.1 thioredoxin reductase [Chryseobacterium vietnamense]TQM22873.1 thioredoxin reductase [Chryseobacterium aquifrigidense]
MENKNFDVIITGGSYSGLSAGMSLGRSLRNVLIIDNGKPCNRQTPHSHNFVTHDGKTPSEIAQLAKKDVEKYNTVQFYNGTVVKTQKTTEGFEIETSSGEKFNAKRLILASGVKDIMPDIPGFAECWGISVIHCPYCHGYEVKNEVTGILSNGDMAYEFSKLIFNLTKNLTLFTNGKAALTEEQLEKLKQNKIILNEDEIESIQHKNGSIQKIIFKNGKEIPLQALYAKIPFEQNLNVSDDLGCELTEQGFIKVDMMQKTTVPGVFACGDNVTMMRSVANAVAQGNFAGAVVNKELSDEEF